MRPNTCIGCKTFPCADVNHAGYVVPGIDVDPARVSIILISEAAPADPAGHYYAGGNPLFEQTTVQAFRDAGAQVSSIGDILDLGVYLTTAVKCAKTGYGIATATVAECSQILAEEIALFPNVRAFLLMGDVAIGAVNAIAAPRGGAEGHPGRLDLQDSRAGVFLPRARGPSRPICRRGRASSSRRANGR